MRLEYEPASEPQRMSVKDHLWCFSAHCLGTSAHFGEVVFHANEMMSVDFDGRAVEQQLTHHTLDYNLFDTSQLASRH